jgi:hypothetical protein
MHALQIVLVFRAIGFVTHKSLEVIVMVLVLLSKVQRVVPTFINALIIAPNLSN